MKLEETDTAAQPRAPAYEPITLKAVMECIAGAIHDARNRTRSLRNSDASAKRAKGVTKKASSALTADPPAKKQKTEATAAAEEPAKSNDMTGVLPQERDLSHGLKIMNSTEIARRQNEPITVKKRSGQRKVKPQKQTDQDKALTANDLFFSSEEGLASEASSSDDSMRWLLQNARVLGIDPITDGITFKMFIQDPKKLIPGKDENDFKELSDNHKELLDRGSYWRLFVSYRGMNAKAFIVNPLEKRHAVHTFAVEHFINIMKDMGAASIPPTSSYYDPAANPSKPGPIKKVVVDRSGELRRVRALDLVQFAACVASHTQTTFADAIHLARWLLLHRVLHRLLTSIGNLDEKSPMLTPTKPITDCNALYEEFKETIKKGRKPKTTAKLSKPVEKTVPKATAATAPPTEAKEPEETDKSVLVKKAIFCVFKLMDRLWWLPRRILDSYLRPFRDPRVLAELEEESLSYAEMSALLLQGWDGIPDGVSEHTLGMMNCVADVYRPASGANRSSAPILHLFKKSSARRSQRRMWQGQYPPQLQFDPRQRRWVIQCWMCSILGNYEHFNPASHPGLALRYMLYHTWSKIKRGASTWRFWEFMLTCTPTLVQHVLRQYMAFYCRYSEIVNEQRKSLHVSETDADLLDRAVDSIVDKTRLLLDRARLMVFTPDVLLFDRVPKTLGPVFDVLEKVIRSRSHSAILGSNYAKVQVGFVQGIRARVRTIPPVHARVSHAMRAEVVKWIASYMNRTFSDPTTLCERFVNLNLGSPEEDEKKPIEKPPLVKPSKGKAKGKSAQKPVVVDSSWPMLSPFIISTIIASYLRFDFYELTDDREPVREDDTIAELCVDRWQFETLRVLVMEHMDPACPRPELLLKAIMPEFGCTEQSVELLGRIIYSHSHAQHIDDQCSKMLHLYPMAYSILHTFVTLWERRTSLVMYPLPIEQLEAQLVATQTKPDSRFVMYCKACARIRTAVREAKDGLRVSARAASDPRYLNVQRVGWTESVASIIDKLDAAEAKGQKLPRLSDMISMYPQAVCNENSIFGDIACYTFGSLVKIPTIGFAMQYRNNDTRLCSFPECGAHATMVSWRCAFWMGAYVCSMCTICLVVIAMRLKRRFGIVGGPFTIEMPYLRTISRNPSAVVLRRILQLEEADAALARAGKIKNKELAEIVKCVNEGRTLTAEQVKKLAEHGADERAAKNARALANKTNRIREAGGGNRRTK